MFGAYDRRITLRLHTLLTGIFADDIKLKHRFFSEEALEEDDDTATGAVAQGAVTLAASAAGVVQDSNSKGWRHIVALVVGTVDVYLDGVKIMSISSNGTDPTVEGFAYGKVVLTGVGVVNTFQFRNPSVSLTPKVRWAAVATIP